MSGPEGDWALFSHLRLLDGMGAEAPLAERIWHAEDPVHDLELSTRRCWTGSPMAGTLPAHPLPALEQGAGAERLA